METPEVKVILIDTPIKAAGRFFVGDYARSEEFIASLRREFETNGIPYEPNKVMGVYYDNPYEKKIDELTSFQGLFLSPGSSIELNEELSEVTLDGDYLYTQVPGNSMTAMFSGYNALFCYVSRHETQLKSPTGYQVTTIKKKVAFTEIYMEIKN